MESPTAPPPPPPAQHQLSEKARGKLPANAPIPLNGAGGSKSAATRSVRFSTQTQNQTAAPLTDVHRRARLRLLPLLSIEADLTRKLFPELAAGLNPLPDAANGGAKPSSPPPLPGVKEVCVRAGNGWKSVLASLQAQGEKSKGKNANGTTTTDELTTVLANCRDDVLSLWEDQAVRAVLRRRGVRLQDMPGL